MRLTNRGAGYTDEEVSFLRAIETYQRRYRRRFPTFTEVLAIARSLGYRLVAEPGPLPRYDPHRESSTHAR